MTCACRAFSARGSEAGLTQGCTATRFALGFGRLTLSAWQSLVHAANRNNDNPTNEYSYFVGFRVAEVSPPCTMMDTDGDGDIDLVDFAAWQACFTGPAG